VRSWTRCLEERAGVLPVHLVGDAHSE
jgi:hypothetical protein